MKRFIYTIISLLLLMSSCKKDAPIENIDSDIEFDTDIKIKMKETLDSSKRTLQFYCFTEKEYGCANYGIKSTFNYSSNSIEIDFKEVLFSDFCLTAFGPARTTIDLGTISNGIYKLNIKVGKNNSEGQIVVTSNSYSILLTNQSQLQLTNSPLHRIPTNTIWGTIGYHTSFSDTLVQSFIDSLLYLGATVQTYEPGDYDYFQIDSSGQILPPQNYGNWIVRPYIFRYSGNTADLKTLLENFGTYYGNSMNIFLYTTKGEEFRS